MDKQEQIQKLLDFHEKMKSKWLLITEEDMYKRIQCLEKMKDIQAELKSEQQEKKIRYDIKLWEILLELKLLTNEFWKKVHTDTTATAIAKKRMEQELIDMNLLKLWSDVLQSKIDTIIEYINIVKIKMRKDNVAI